MICFDCGERFCRRGGGVAEGGEDPGVPGEEEEGWDPRAREVLPLSLSCCDK